ncbi:MAG: diguanylate cyclase protein [Bacteroidetes bacterium]|nr:diguanylate cyclase protein [Bacteroidota bacterium]
MRILAVDDNKGFLSVIGDLLRDCGHEVFLAEDGKQAREFLEDEKVDLIISDVFMPTLDGSRFHSYVREFTDASRVPFIFISGFDDEHTKKLVVDSKIDFFVSKTAPIEDVVGLIDRIKRELHLETVKQ